MTSVPEEIEMTKIELVNARETPIRPSATSNGHLFEDAANDVEGVREPASMHGDAPET